MENQKVWFVTGASKGLGLTLVKTLLNNGVNVAATSRNLNDLINAVGEHKNFLPLAVDLIDESSVEAAVSQTISKFGQLDVVVNNAGYGMLGALEELSDKESRQNFDVNVFGSLNVIRKVLPQLRKQQSGHIFNISSIGGFSGNFPGFGIYCATKFAVVGFTESLAAEVKSMGIKATVVEPGYFRTAFLTEGSLAVPSNPIDAYKEVRDSQAVHQNDINNQQPGDPAKAVEVIIEASKSENPPLHLFLGPDAYQVADGKIADVQRDMANWKYLATATNFDEVGA
ncbi:MULTISPECIES: SDR family oxidoreductase [unclassified Pedobacter]|uniref:SDR family oxidoreductase n=1 Tax=unclassified Pedobacter TaxID=2628915 RepID=UPI00141DD603|nr:MULTISPECIES: SDR family oxidoreductase [unclassified Pedobacter]NII82993.1 NAD(P)-dependent dehydrogenase (short-subunit alcohol dehydrogenase family) [Pedobacter sp. SG908]NMN37011.1 NAD(P)-dependent dehydrogenase (short-subunit alcohol dehydrogenase family) [Pedobacter sp. SG918]